jgi:hypothetical protein
MDGHPVEGRDFWYIKGSNPGSTYFHVKDGVNVNTELLAEMLHVEPFSIRADNPTKTLALCKLPRDKSNPRAGIKFVMGEGIHTPEDRASNAVWFSICPEAENQYVYLVPGENIEITGRKHLSPADQSRIVRKISACAAADDACLLAGARELVGKTPEGASAPPAGMEPAASPTLPMVPPAATQAPAPAVAAAPAAKVEIDSELDQKNRDLTAQLAQKDREIAQLKEQNANSKEVAQGLGEQNSATKNEVTTLKSELEASDFRTAVLTKELNALKQANADLEAKGSSGGTAETMYFKWAMSVLTFIVLGLCFMLILKDRKLAKLQRQSLKNGTEASKAEVQNRQLREKVTGLEKHLADEIAENAQLKIRVGQLGTELAAAQSQVRDMATKLEMTECAFVTTDQELDRCKTELVAARRSAEEYARYETRRLEAMTRCVEVLHELTEHDPRPAEIRADIAHHEEMLKTFETDQAALRDVCDEMGAGEYDERIRLAATRVAELEYALKQVNKSVDDAWREFDALLSQLAGVSVSNTSLFAQAKRFVDEAIKERVASAEVLAKAQTIIAGEKDARARLEGLFSSVGKLLEGAKGRDVASRERDNDSRERETQLRRMWDPLLRVLGEDTNMQIEGFAKLGSPDDVLRRAAANVNTYAEALKRTQGELNQARGDYQEIESVLLEAQKSRDTAKLALSEVETALAEQRGTIEALQRTISTGEVQRLPHPSSPPPDIEIEESTGVRTGSGDRGDTIPLPSMSNGDFAELMRQSGTHERIRTFGVLGRVAPVFKETALDVRTTTELDTLRDVSVMLITAFEGMKKIQFRLGDLLDQAFSRRVSALPRAAAVAT